MSMLYNPDIQSLCAAVKELRSAVMQRCGSIGCQVDERSKPVADAIVDATIAECLGSAEFQAIAEPYYGGNDKAFDLLIGKCSDALFEAIPQEPIAMPTNGSWRYRRPDSKDLDLGIVVLGQAPLSAGAEG